MSTRSSRLMTRAYPGSVISRSRRGNRTARGVALAITLFALALVSAGWVARDAASDQSRATRAEIVAQLPRELSRARMRADLLAFERIADRSGGNRAAGTAGYRASVAHVRAELSTRGIRASRRRLSLRPVPGERREGSPDRADPARASRRGARLLAVDPERRPSRKGGRSRRRLRAWRLRRRAGVHRARTAGHLLLRRQGEERGAMPARSPCSSSTRSPDCSTAPSATPRPPRSR